MINYNTTVQITYKVTNTTTIDDMKHQTFTRQICATTHKGKRKIKKVYFQNKQDIHKRMYLS